MKVNYQGESITVYRLGKISGIPLTVLYRAYHKGERSGEDMIAARNARKVTYLGKPITIRQLAVETNNNYTRLKRRILGGMSPEAAVVDKVDRRGCVAGLKLCPSEVLVIYKSLFNKEKTQAALANEYGVHQSTISDIWRHRRWGWLVAPIRYELENNTLGENNEL